MASLEHVLRLDRCQRHLHIASTCTHRDTCPSMHSIITAKKKKEGKGDEKATKGFWARDPEATPVQRITTVRLTDVHLFLLWLIVDLYTCTGSWQCACMCVCFLVLGFVYYFCVSLGRLFILLCYHEIKIILKIQQPPWQKIWAISQLLNTINEKEVHNTCMLELDIQLQIYCTYLNFFVKRWNNKVLVNQ